MYVFAAAGTFSLMTLTLILKTILCTLAPMNLCYKFLQITFMLYIGLSYSHIFISFYNLVLTSNQTSPEALFCYSDLKNVF